MTPVGAGHERRWTTTDAALGGGTFGSGGLYACWALARRLVRQVTRQPCSTAARVCGEHRGRMETRSVGGGAVGFSLRALATAQGADESSREPLLRSTVALSGSGGDATPSRAIGCYENKVLWYLLTVLTYQSHVTTL